MKSEGMCRGRMLAIHKSLLPTQSLQLYVFVVAATEGEKFVVCSGLAYSTILDEVARVTTTISPPRYTFT